MVLWMRKWNFPGWLDERFPMKKSCFTEAQIMSVLRQAEGGLIASELCRGHGISSATFFKWRAKYGGMECVHDEPDEGP